jgi:hypothetical protein
VFLLIQEPCPYYNSKIKGLHAQLTHSFFIPFGNFEGLEFEKKIIPLGPSVTETVSASLLMPRSKLNLQSSPKRIFFPVDLATKLLPGRDWILKLSHFDFQLFAKKQTNNEIMFEREKREIVFVSLTNSE